MNRTFLCTPFQLADAAPFTPARAEGKVRECFEVFSFFVPHCKLEQHCWALAFVTHLWL